MSIVGGSFLSRPRPIIGCTCWECWWAWTRHGLVGSDGALDRAVELVHIGGADQLENSALNL